MLAQPSFMILVSICGLCLSSPSFASNPASAALISVFFPRDLDMTHADDTLNHLRTLWGRDCYLLTQVAAAVVVVDQVEGAPAL